MARLDTYNINSRVLDLLQVLVIFQAFQPSSLSVEGLESRHQAFIQTDKQLTYIIGDSFIDSGVPLEIKPGSSFSNEDFEDERLFSNIVRLDPSWLDFDEQPVGMPRMEKVVVQNNDPKHSVHLLSISGSTAHFHCSFFQDKVFGVGIPNPYRLRPYLGARVPINSSFTPVIQMHNPYSTRLQVLEMFASEGDLHLELPSGEKEAKRELWELQPFETKAVMKAKFVGRVENHHSAFIRIRTNKEAEHPGPPELLILPMEVEVSSEPGIYSPVELIDFGILRTLDVPKTVPLNLINTGPKAVHITSISISPPNDAVSVDFRPFKLQPDGSRPSSVAQITFRAVKALNPKQWSGRIVIKTKNNIQRLVIPYQANVLHGSLVYNVNSTYFFSAKALWNVTRPLVFTNTFNFSVVVYNVSFPADVAPYFSVLNFSQPVMIAPQHSSAVFLVQFHPNQTQIHFHTVLTVSTNASIFNIPIIVYNGLMKVIHHRPEKFEGQLDFGTLGVGEKRSMIFTIRNDNPVDIVVAQFETNMTWASVEIIGMEKGNGTTLTRKHNQSEINIDPLYIKPYHYAVFNVSIVAPYVKGAYVADIWMFTQFQDLFIPIIFRAAEGSLHAIPDKFVFDKVYPGHVPHKVLQIRSTFDDFMEVTQVTFQPPDDRFYFTPHNSNTVLLQPHQLTSVGKIYFDARRNCKEDCYVGLPTLSPAGHQWLLGLSLDKDVADTDQYLYTKFHQKWDRLESQQQNIANVTLELDTTQVRGFLFSAQAHLQWPQLTRKAKIKYPLTQIGNLSISDFIIENPVDEPVVIQALPLSLYPNPHTILELMSERLTTDMTDYIESDETNSFILYDLEPAGSGSTTSSATPTIAQHRKTLEQLLGVIPHKQTVAAFLQPGAKVKVKVGFQPKDDLARSSLIVIRNNLTIIDAVVIQGQGRRGEMRFNNKKPGSNSPLTFEMTEKHLKNCDDTERKGNKNMMPNFTVRRPFTLRNSGDLPFYIHGFSINELACEGYGFKVLDCSGFEMAPNSSKKINIAFTPDFTMSQIQRMLTIHTSLGTPASRANFSLQAMVPYDLLSQCSAALPRPSWEPLLYYFVVVFMAFVILCILILSYFESDRVMADYIRRKLKVSNSTQTFDKGKIFDLRSISGLGLATSSSQMPSNVASVQPRKGHQNTPVAGITTSSNGRGITNGLVQIDRGIPGNSFAHNHMVNNGSDISTHFPSARAINSSPNTSYNGSSNNNKSWRRAVVGPFVKILKSISVYKYFTWNKKQTIQSGTSPPSPVQKPTATVSALRQEPKVVTPQQEIQPEKPAQLNKTSSSNQQNFANRGRKGRLNNRRQIVVDASGDTNPEVTHRKSPKDSKEIFQGILDHSKSSPLSMIDDFDDISIYTGPSLGSENDINDNDYKPDLSSIKNGKRLNKTNKSKGRSEGGSKERQLLRRDSSLADDGDDVSSTTTESSGGDSEEKILLGGEAGSEMNSGVEEPAISGVTGGKKWKKGSNKHGDRMVVATYGADAVDDESNFEVTSKSKAHRKVRVNKETFGGDIMIPSTIELPYCLPKEKERAEHENVKRSKKAKKSAQKNKDVSHSLLPHPTLETLRHRHHSGEDGSIEAWEGCSSGRESPPPAWDAEPTQLDPVLLPGDLSEISLQTETFAQKHHGNTLREPSSNALGPPPGLGGTSGLSTFGPIIGSGNAVGSKVGSSAATVLPSIGSGGRVLSSYSSIVSSNNNNSGMPSSTATKTSAGSSGGLQHGGSAAFPSASAQSSNGFSGIGSDMSGRTNVFGPSGFGPFTDTGLPGFIGLNQTQKTASTWGSVGESSFGMQAVGDPSGYGFHSARSADRYFYGDNADPRDQYGSQLYPGMLSEQQHGAPQMTMMQQLQVERRQRLYEHQQKVFKGEDWPGFSNPPVRNESLWDPDCSPMEPNAWVNNSTNGPVGGTGFWSTLTNSASNGWSSLQSLANIWGSSGSTAASSMSSQSAGSSFTMAPSRQMSPPGQGTANQLSSTTPPFNPFTSMADIWSPTSIGGDSPGNSSTQWSPMSSLGAGDIQSPSTPNTSKEE